MAFIVADIFRYEVLIKRYSMIRIDRDYDTIICHKYANNSQDNKRGSKNITISVIILFYQLNWRHLGAKSFE